MDEGRRLLFDASAYMLFEATGDSEAVFSDAAFDHESEAAAADDDAQSSCTYGSSFCDSSQRLHDVVNGGEDMIRAAEFDYSSGDEEEEDGVVDQCRCRSWAEPTKSETCEGANMNMMNEREGDKLFWEACLAS